MTDSNAKFLGRDTLAATLGSIFWLMNLSKEHRDKPVRSIEDVVLPALLLGSFKLIMRDGQAAAFVSWAGMSDDAKARFERGEPLELEDWKSGPHFVITECVSPFMPADQVKAKIHANLEAKIQSPKSGATDANAR